MSSFLLQKQQIHCNCFGNSPKNERSFFRMDSAVSLNRYIEESQQLLLQMTNNSEQRKQKKKSLKKEKPTVNYGSEKDQKQKEEAHNNNILPQIPTLYGAHQNKNYNKIVSFDAHCNQSHLMRIKLQRPKPFNSSHQQKPQVLLQPLSFEMDHRKQPQTPTLINSQRKRNDEEFDKKISQEFQNDLRQLRQAMEKVEQQNLKQKNAINKKRKQSLQVNKSQLLQAMTLNDPTHEIRYSATQQLIPQINHTQSFSKAISFRNSRVSNKQKIFIKKQTNKIQPRQIESLRDSNCSSEESDKFSEVVGRGWDGLTTIRVSTCEISEDNCKRENGGLETMTTQQSHLKSSNIHTLTEFSNIITSPKSMIQREMGFGGGHKYGLTGMSFQQLDIVRQPKCTGSSKLIF